jgi:pSer/pThr/pTyr-binding forkhead associated (FHA) protein
MDIQKDARRKVYELISLDNEFRARGLILQGRRLLVGRAESCDVVILNPAVSSVHAVFEIYPDGIQIFDMNSTNGTYINDTKVVAAKAKVGDTIFIANQAFSLKEYNPNRVPPVLDTLNPVSGESLPDLPVSAAREKQSVNVTKALPKSIATAQDKDTPYVVYPLSADPKAEFSEYIFEDLDVLYPIFRYEIDQHAVEIMILFEDKVFSVDYLPLKNGTYFLAGNQHDDQNVEFPYLGKNQKQPFVEISNGSISVLNIPDYQVLHLKDKEIKKIAQNSGYIPLNSKDLIKFSKGKLEIYVRETAAPPKVKTAPIMRRDDNFKQYLFLSLFFVLIPMFGLQLFEVDKEIEKEKVPERIATILYKEKLIVSKNDAIKKTEKAPPVAQTSPKKIEEPKEKAKDEPKASPEPVTAKQDLPKTEKPVGKKEAKVEQVVKKAEATPAKEKVAAKKPSPTPAKAPAPTPSIKPIERPAFRPAVTPTKAVGRVDVFKSADFSSAMSSVMAKGGGPSSATAVADYSLSETSSVKVGGGSVDSLKKADIASDTGSLVGSTIGKIGDSKGVEGMSINKTIHTAGIPSDTIVLGSMDPDIIRRILREHIPQFRFCYQKELDAGGKEESGDVHMNFLIGASGHVTKAGVKKSGLSPSVSKCVVNVLYGIRFPKPAGGADVEVSQPINFYPKRI